MHASAEASRARDAVRRPLQSCTPGGTERHLPAQFFGPEEPFPGLEGHDGVMVIQYDHTAEHYLEHLGVRHARMERSLPVPFRHAEHTH